ncbi:MAG: AEC family transporter [candidate division KSB1 bacterium]|nr:AEC family transporter [candidate division KSB1 bacterium]MDZ7339736.1 AEC family transporter [candidate division KSB1 bacterium]
MENLIFSINGVAPVFLIVFIGWWLKKRGLINGNFINLSSKIVFSLAAPALVFESLSRTDLQIMFSLKEIGFVYASVCFFFALSWLLASILSSSGRDRGAFIQGSFRSNFAIIGFALVANLFGTRALGKAAILLAFVMPLYNVLAIVALTAPLHHEKKLGWKKILFEIITNPLILATAAAIPFSYFDIELPQFITTTVHSLAAITLPLALLGIGGSLDFESIKKESRLAIAATVLKIVVIPATITLLALRLGLTGEDLGVIFLLFATPSAIVSFVMAEAMGSNSALAGNIIVMTTLGSIFTISLGVFLLKSVGLF